MKFVLTDLCILEVTIKTDIKNNLIAEIYRSLSSIIWKNKFKPRGSCLYTAEKIKHSLSNQSTKFPKNTLKKVTMHNSWQDFVTKVFARR